MQEKEVEKACFNCASYLSLPEIGPAGEERGVCLRDEDFAPYAEKIVETLTCESCRELAEKKQIDGNRPSCQHFERGVFEELELPDDFFEEEDEPFSEQLILEALDKIIEKIDFSKFSVDRFTEGLKSGVEKERKSSLNSLNAYAAMGNERAFQELVAFFRGLPPPRTLDEVHFKVYCLKLLNGYEFKKELFTKLVQELYDTESNNTTRQYFSCIFEYLKFCPYEKIRDPLEEMLACDRFSEKLKRRIEIVLEESAYYADEN